MINIGGKFGNISFMQDSVGGVSVGESLAGAIAATITGGYGSIIDDLQVSFLIRATLAHAESKVLNAPKVTVLSGESAAIRVETEWTYIADYEFEDITQAGLEAPTRVIADPQPETILDGVVLNVTPTISADKKYVLLRMGVLKIALIAQGYKNSLSRMAIL